MKVAICTPVYETCRWQFVASLSDLLLYESARGTEVKYLTTPGHFVGDQRNRLAARALDWGADHLLWLDSDQTFPSNTLEWMLSRGVDIIGANYARREDIAGPTAGRLSADGTEMLPVWTDKGQVERGVVEEVDGLGFGVCLTSRAVFEQVPSPWFAPVSEDYRFCAKAKLAGFKVWCDHGLSAHVGHVYERVLTIADMAAGRPLYQLSRRTKG